MSSDLLSYNSIKITQIKCFEWISGFILNELMFLDPNYHPKSNLYVQKVIYYAFLSNLIIITIFIKKIKLIIIDFNQRL